MTAPVITLHAERKELEPTEPDAQGTRWTRCRGTGRVRWECVCGDSRPWESAQTANATAIDHAQTHQEDTE